MPTLEPLLDTISPLFAHRLPRPEYRQIELYSKKKKLAFAPASPAADPHLALLHDSQLAFWLLDTHFAAQDPLLLEGSHSWARYLALPRQRLLDKIAAELYRILRISRIAATHAQGHVEYRDGLLRLACNFNLCALSLNITPAGISLLNAAVYTYLDAARQPYSEAYQEALLLQYFFDLVGEIRKFADEDRVLFQFRQTFPFFNRHFRYDCDNPKVQAGAERWQIEISPRYRDPVRYPIDFYLSLDHGLCIVPVEALAADSSLAVAELPRWQARLPDGGLLPATFAQRFSREEMIVGLPMT